jgi:hypothetical protein
MKRGPEPVKGSEVAIPVALRRGRVMRFRSSPTYVSNFLIYGNGLLVLVSLRLAWRLFRAILAEINADYADANRRALHGPLRGAGVPRALWLYSRHGALRFFRVGADGVLKEIDRDGVPFVDGKPADSGLPDTGKADLTAPAPAVGMPAGSGSADPRGADPPLAGETECHESSGRTRSRCIRHTGSGKKSGRGWPETGSNRGSGGRMAGLFPQ